VNSVIDHKLNGPAPLAAETRPNFRKGIDNDATHIAWRLRAQDFS
jgi:hypothetical protein